jgi:hypothetical protein
MRNLNTPNTLGVAVRAVLVSLLAAGPVAVAGADPVPGMLWTSVGSAGTVDEADLGIVLLDGAVAQHAGAAGQVVNIRYNVVAVDALAAVGIFMAASFRDTGASSRIVVTLKRYSFTTAITEDMVRLDSDAFPARFGFQTREVGDGCTVGGFNFNEYAYFIDAELHRIATPLPTVNQGALAALKLSTTWC